MLLCVTSFAAQPPCAGRLSLDRLGRNLSGVWWLRLDDAEWPDGVAWPEGFPRTKRSWRTGAESTIWAVGTLGLMFGFKQVGLGPELAVLAALAVGTLIGGLVIARRVALAARRQGWGSNIWPPLA